MSDILSQEEIDRLLNAASSGSVSSANSSTASEELDKDGLVVLTNLANQVFAAADTTLSTLIARQAQVARGTGSMGTAADLDNKKNVFLKAPFRSGFAGELCFVLDARTSAMLADLILGGEGAGKTDLAEGDDDAVKELFGQVLGNAAPMITGSAGFEVGFEMASLRVCAAGTLESALGKGKIFLCKGRITVEGVVDAPLYVAILGSTAVAMAKALGAAKEEEREPPPPPRGQVETFAPKAAPKPARPYPVAAPQADIRNIDLILDIEVEVMVRLGNAQMPLREIQKLRPGSIIDLDRDTDALVELVVNDRIIAKGELVVVSSDHFALRVTEIVTQTERIRSLGGE